MIAFYIPIDGYDLFTELPESMMSGMVRPMIINHFTLFGLRVVGEVLSGLIPDEQYVPAQFILQDTESDFDYFYWRQLLEKPESFMDLMRFLSVEFQIGPQALNIIWIQDDYQYKRSIYESLGNFLNAMYGLDIKYITSLDDIYEPDSFPVNFSQFSQEGIARMTNDMIRYETMLGVKYPDD